MPIRGGGWNRCHPRPHRWSATSCQVACRRECPLAAASGQPRQSLVAQPLYERYHQPLYRYCRSILRDDADAQDALQSTFTAACTALRRGQRSAPLRPWLFRIAHNESISLLRRRRDREDASAVPPGLTPSAEDRAGERARLETLLADLSELPHRLRSALVMRELNGLSHEEIAIALGVSVGAAKQAIFEARRALMEFVEGRAMSCDDVQRVISDGDRRVLRGRRVRAHLRDCVACEAFAAAIPARTNELRALTPALAPAAAAALFGHTVKAAASSGGGGIGGGAAAGAVGKTVAASAVSKVAAGAVVAVTAAAGVGGVTVVLHLTHNRDRGLGTTRTGQPLSRRPSGGRGSQERISEARKATGARDARIAPRTTALPVKHGATSGRAHAHALTRASARSVPTGGVTAAHSSTVAHSGAGRGVATVMHHSSHSQGHHRVLSTVHRPPAPPKAHRQTPVAAGGALKRPAQPHSHAQRDRAPVAPNFRRSHA